MENISYKEGYKLFADQFGFEFDDQRYIEPAPAYEHAHDAKTTIYVLRKEEIVFIAYDMRSTTPYMSKIYSGLYTTLDAPDDYNCKIAKRIPILDLFSKPVMGNKYIDKKVTVKTNDIRLTNRLIDETIIKQYLNTWNEEYPSEIIMGKTMLGDKGMELLNNRNIVGLEFNKFLAPGILRSLYPQINGIIQAIREKA